MHLFLTGLIRYVACLVQVLASPFRDGRRFGGTLLLLLGLPMFIVLQCLHWLGFLLDEILFPGYRRVELQAPVFVLGPPRSGTTHLHRVLAADPDTTTFRTWECLFGLSVSARKLILALASIDSAVGSPIGRLAGRLGRRNTAMADIHRVALDEPEEDFLCLMPIAACFLLIVPFPRSAWLWRLARFDTELPQREQQRVLRYYRRCIQKHLYVFGREKRFLSKNASFSGASRALLREFPDARILFTVRDPVQTVPSQLSSLRPALQLCGFPTIGEQFRDSLVGLLEYYYVQLAEAAKDNPGRLAMLYNDALRNDLAGAVSEAMKQVGLPVGRSLRQHLDDLAPASRTHSSRHEYSLEEFGLSNDDIRRTFDAAYALYDFAGRAADPAVDA